MKKMTNVLVFVASLALAANVFACKNNAGGNGVSGGGETTVVQGMVKLELKGKSFQMGANYTDVESDEKTIHKVAFTRDIYMCDHEVTQKEWQAVMGSNPSSFQGEEADKKVADGEVQEMRPVEQVSWYDAIAYCNKLSIKDGLEPCYSVKVGGTEVDWANLKYADIPTSDNANWNAAVCDFSKTGYRLPTEAEWEIAARGGLTGDVYAGTNDVSKLGDYAWYIDNSDKKTHEVKKKQPNGYGLYDMSGDVWEWCWDWGGSYGGEEATDPTGASSGSYRVHSGGGWGGGASYCRASFRGDFSQYGRYLLGYRLVRTVQ